MPRTGERILKYERGEMTRKISIITKEEAYNYARDLIDQGIKQCATDVNLFKTIFVEKSRKDLILIARAYYELHQKCFYDDIIEESVLQKSLFDDQEEDNIEQDR